MEKVKIGYTAGVFDMFHIGHLNLLKNAKDKCDYLIVGVSTDELSMYKNKMPIIPFEERLEIVSSCRFVDKVIPQENMDKFFICKKYNVNTLFVGDDWKGTDKWVELEKELIKINTNITYFPYTKSTSSSILKEKLISRK